MNENIKIAKQLIKIADELTADYIDKNNLRQIYKQQIIDQKKLHDLYDIYSNEVSEDIKAGVKQHSKTITIISLRKWLKDKRHEDWTEGKKYDALFKLNKDKLEQKTGCEIIKEMEGIFILSPQKLYKELQDQIKKEKSNQSNRIFKGAYPNKQQLKKIYKENIN